MANKNNLKLAIPTDAISMDIETSFLVGLDWGINCYELKRLFNRSKIVYVKNNDIWAWSNKGVKEINDVQINRFKEVNKDIKIILNEMPFDKALKTYNDYLDFDKVV